MERRGEILLRSSERKKALKSKTHERGKQMSLSGNLGLKTVERVAKP